MTVIFAFCDIDCEGDDGYYCIDIDVRNIMILFNSNDDDKHDNEDSSDRHDNHDNHDNHHDSYSHWRRDLCSCLCLIFENILCFYILFIYLFILFFK